MQQNQVNYLITIKDQDVLRDLSSLISLYEPIIGAHALALYLCLTNEAATLKQLNYPKFELSRLYRISALSEKTFAEAIKKLESLRLVKSKVSRKTGIKKYEIFSPLDPSEFFANELFEKTLASKVGPENVEALRFLFKEKTDYELEDDFEDITAGFEDVFAEELAQIATLPCSEQSNFANLRGTKKTILEKMLNLKLLTALLKEAQIRINYETPSIKKSFNWALSIINFNEESLASIIIESFDQETKKLNLKTFENHVKSFVFSKKKLKNTSQTPIFTPINYELSNSQLSEINKMNVKNPVVVVQELTSQTPDLPTRKMIQVLSQDYHLEKGAINYLIEFSCFKNQNRIIVNYIYKIASSLKEFGITKAIDVMVYLYQLKQYNYQKQLDQQEPNLVKEWKTPTTWKPLTNEEIVKLAGEM